ncbi:hypothetical protein GUJ93_ZPchr0012g19405 [Zizania palustris]|uniref:Uncharacterized protein n=1 Tax=Zizania palustris TaxID=103762 RepID=A0A8J6BT21_ZIZPA|nr:hypothetical protein GUJ93_ZPchr0012g19405 [Zizania palustris]
MDVVKTERPPILVVLGVQKAPKRVGMQCGSGIQSRDGDEDPEASGWVRARAWGRRNPRGTCLLVLAQWRASCLRTSTHVTLAHSLVLTSSSSIAAALRFKIS